jgi:hypothetical protein
VLRQDEHTLIQAINEIARGRPSDQTIAVLKFLNKPPPIPPDKKVVLFATNALAESYNKQMLFEHPGEEKEYVGRDEGEQQSLQKLTFEKVQYYIHDQTCVVVFSLAVQYCSSN